MLERMGGIDRWKASNFSVESGAREPATVA